MAVASFEIADLIGMDARERLLAARSLGAVVGITPDGGIAADYRACRDKGLARAALVLDLDATREELAGEAREAAREAAMERMAIRTGSGMSEAAAASLGQMEREGASLADLDAAARLLEREPALTALMRDVFGSEIESPVLRVGQFTMEA